MDSDATTLRNTEERKHNKQEVECDTHESVGGIFMKICVC